MTGLPNGNGEPKPEPRPFTKGWKGGPGNPFAGRVMAYRKALMDAVDTEDVARIAKTLVNMAVAGDVPAAKLILERTAGKPIEVTEDEGGALVNLARYMRAFVEAAQTAVEGDPNAKPLQEAPDDDSGDAT